MTTYTDNKRQAEEQPEAVPIVEVVLIVGAEPIVEPEQECTKEGCNCFTLCEECYQKEKDDYERTIFD